MSARADALRGTPEHIQRHELRRQRRDVAEAVVFDMILDGEQEMARLTAANSLIDRVDGKAVARIESSGPGGQPMEHVLHAQRSPKQIIAEHSAKRQLAHEQTGSD